MSLNDKILVFENRIIDFLTMFTWWFEVRFDKTNIYLAAVASILTSVFGFIAFTSNISDLFEKKNWFLLFISVVFAFCFAIAFLLKVLCGDLVEEKIIKHNPQGIPNPCRISKKHSEIRRMEIITLFVVVFSAKSDIFSISFFASLFCSFLFSLLIACDSIPPKEKQKRVSLLKTYSRLAESGT
jgi:hypothetical protein